MKKEIILKKVKKVFKSIGTLFINIFKVIRRIIKKLIKATKELSKKDFGKVKGIYVVRVFWILVALFFVGAFFREIFSVDTVNYSVVYKTNENKLMLLKHNGQSGDEIKLSGEGSANYVMYANTTNRYVLFVKNDGLYLYDSKSKEQTTKLVSNISDYYNFTENDKYIVMKDDNSNLYVYDYGSDKERIDTAIKNVEGLSNKNIVYVKDGALYVKGLKVSKDDKEKITDSVLQAKVTTDGKYVYYIDGTRTLNVYNVSKKKSTEIDDRVTQMYIDEETGKMYYLTSESARYYNIYYYDGKKSEKVAEDIYSIVDYDALKEQVLYLKKDTSYQLYYQKGTKKADLVEDKIKTAVTNGYIYKNKAIYYITNKDELKYAKINGAKVKRVIDVSDNVSSSLYLTEKGFVYLTDVNDKSMGDLNIVKGPKAKRIDSNVYSSQLKVSNNGKKIYYLKDYENGKGDLYVTSGGKGKQLVKNVYSYQYANDKLIYYIKNYSLVSNRGDLYRYDGKSEKIQKDVYASIATMPEGYDK